LRRCHERGAYARACTFQLLDGEQQILIRMIDDEVERDHLQQELLGVQDAVLHVEEQLVIHTRPPTRAIDHQHVWGHMRARIAHPLTHSHTARCQIARRKSGL